METAGDIEGGFRKFLVYILFVDIRSPGKNDSPGRPVCSQGSRLFLCQRISPAFSETTALTAILPLSKAPTSWLPESSTG